MNSVLTKEEAIEMLASLYSRERIMPNDITATEMMERWGVCKNTVHRRMKEVIKAGKFIKVDVINEHGKCCVAYRPVPNGDKPKKGTQR